MKKLVLGALTAAVISQAAGCIISSGDDSGNDAFITANWSVKSLATGASSPCPADPTYDTAALYSQEVDANGNNIGQPIIDLFDCAAGHGTSAPLAPSTYYSWIVIANHDNTDQFATSIEAPVDLTVADKSFTATLLEDGGYFQVAWNLTDAATGSPLLCSDIADIGGVEAISTDVSTPSNAASDIFPCEDHFGITGGFLAGTYTVHVDALNMANPPQSIGDAQDLLNKTIQPQNVVTDLGTVTIPIN
jgi:hypothetical protein